VAGLATTFGSGAMTNSINEIDNAQVILVSGSNTTTSHPQVARRIINAVDRGAKLIVIDPRRTKLARLAHIHLAIRPGSDIALLNAMMRIILDQNLADDVFIEMRTENFLPLRDMLFRLNLNELLAVAGVTHDEVSRAAQFYARANKAVICYCMGITQHICGTDNVQSFANLAMLTGHVEQEDTGLDPLRGQNNVQGACDMGALPAVFPGYQPVADAEIRARFARAWETELPEEPGRTLMEMTHAEADPPIKALLIIGENPMLSDPVLNRVQESLRHLEFLAVSDMFLTETAVIADVVFPACSFAEKTGTYTNSERRVQLVRQAIPPLGESRSDGDLLTELASRMEYPMTHASSAEIMEEIALLTPIYGGIYYDRLEENHGLQWPCYDRNHPGTPYLHKYSFSRGKGHFVPSEYLPPFEQPDADYPLTLITGRIYHHFHTGSMSRKSPQLAREGGAACLEMNRADAEKLHIRNGERIRLISRRAAITLAAEITDQVGPGMVFTSFAFAEAPVNAITVGARDPVAKIPEFKVCAVRVEKAEAAA
jgi:predicted molibdopterin-dependent oxidoreductase YjgC